MTTAQTVVLIVLLCYLAAGLCVLPILIGASVFGIRIRVLSVVTVMGWGAIVAFLFCLGRVWLA